MSELLRKKKVFWLIWTEFFFLIYFQFTNIFSISTFCPSSRGEKCSKSQKCLQDRKLFPTQLYSYTERALPYEHLPERHYTCEESRYFYGPTYMSKIIYQYCFQYQAENQTIASHCSSVSRNNRKHLPASVIFFKLNSKRNPNAPQLTSCYLSYFKSSTSFIDLH